MMDKKSHTVFVARVLLSLLFVVAGYNKLMDYSGTLGFVTSLGFPIPTVMTILLIIFELVGGLMLLVGFKTKWAAYALALVALIAAVVAHNPFEGQTGAFLKNMAVIGGMILITKTGPGSFSVDKN